MVAVIWIMSALISFLPIQLDWHTLELTPPPTSTHPPLITTPSPIHSTFNISIAEITSNLNTFQNSTYTKPNYLNSTFYNFLSSNKSLFDTSLSLTSPEDDDVCQLELSPMYAVVSSTISFYLPCLAMTLIYYRLLQYAKKHVSHIKMTTTSHVTKNTTTNKNKNIFNKKSKTPTIEKINPPLTPKTTNSLTPTNKKHNNPSKKHSSNSTSVTSTATSQYKTSDHKASVTLGIIMGVFLVCWAPFFTVNVVDSFCRFQH